MNTNWIQTDKGDDWAWRFVREHYSRQKPDAKDFVPPGYNLVLKLPNSDQSQFVALWNVNRSIHPRLDGMEYWSNTIFRKADDTLLASECILQAIRVTLWLWGGQNVPKDGIHTFIDPRKVQGQKLPNGELMWGYSYFRAGFKMHPDYTIGKKLIRLIFPREKLLKLDPCPPMYSQTRLL